MSKSSLYITLLALMVNCLLSSIHAQDKPAFRGVWFSTVVNIDWPTKEAVGNSAMQQQEMIDLLDRLEALHLNALFFQVRPTADALYPSDLEPWSEWLTGKQGQDNDVPYDPLAMMIREAHRRNIDVHVWINPYRITMKTTSVADLASGHRYRQHPEWCWQYDGQWYYDPAREETIAWLCRVVADLVRRYDIEGVHMDDYFYPYPDHKTALPDAAYFKAHPRGFTNIGDWRRDNVNRAVKALHDTIKHIKPHVQFGISPFGIWRNKQNDPDGSLTNGMQTYDDQYADVLLWIRKGWIDYVVPQLYWNIGSKAADYKELANWWARHATDQTKVYIGMAAYRQQDHVQAAKEGKKLNPKDPWVQGNELCRQMRLNRQIQGIDGEVFFSVQPLLRNPKHFCDSLKTTFYPTRVSTPK